MKLIEHKFEASIPHSEYDFLFLEITKSARDDDHFIEMEVKSDAAARHRIRMRVSEFNRIHRLIEKFVQTTKTMEE